MSIEVLRRELDQTSNTLNVVILSISEATSALDEYDNLRRTLEKIRNEQFICADKDCTASLVAQAALSHAEQDGGKDRAGDAAERERPI